MYLGRIKSYIVKICEVGVLSPSDGVEPLYFENPDVKSVYGSEYTYICAVYVHNHAVCIVSICIAWTLTQYYKTAV